MQVVFIILLSYFLGSIPFGYLIGRLRGVNLLEVGSKSTGTTNAFRALGFGWALLTFLLDLLKGVLAVYFANLFFANQYSLIALSGLLAIIGHTLTPFLGFKGGKGVATGLGVLVFLTPGIALVGFVVETSIILITRYVSLGSLITGPLMVGLTFIPFFGVPWEYQCLITVAVGYIVYKHVPNIHRLLQGKENKI
ncbi:MAG: glycerol-3-phosphate 1-O-acyltransferase PlsY [Candidatus Margulisiibacteriota bacterium]